MKTLITILIILILICSCSNHITPQSELNSKKIYVVNYGELHDTIIAYNVDYYIGIFHGFIQFFDFDNNVVYMINYPVKEAIIVPAFKRIK